MAGLTQEQRCCSSSSFLPTEKRHRCSNEQSLLSFRGLGCSGGGGRGGGGEPQCDLSGGHSWRRVKDHIQLLEQYAELCDKWEILCVEM